MGNWLTDWLSSGALHGLLSLPFGEGVLALAFFALTASVYASGIPGTLLPLSFSSGALLGWVLGIAAVGGGALLGSIVLYALLERGTRRSLRRKLGRHAERLDGWAARGGILPIIGLRLAGVPHLAVTALCALAGVGTRRYVLATALGVLPAIALTTVAGASV